MGRAALKFLLDTHVWIWAILEPGRLGAPTAARIEDGDAELWLSPVSIWEALLLAERGKIDLGGDHAGWIEFALREFPVRDARLDRMIATASRSIELPHQDPADRFLAATAKVQGLTLLTHDAALLGSTEFASIGP